MRRGVLLAVLLVLAGPLAVAEEPSDATLVERLSSSSDRVRGEAAHAAGPENGPEVLDRLLVMAAKDPHPNVRVFAIQALGRFRDERIVPLLLERIEAESSLGPRNAAIERLGASRDPRTYESLLRALGFADATIVAARALGALGDRRAVPHLLAMSDKVGRGPTRDAIAGAMLTLEPEAALAFVMPVLRTGWEWEVEAMTRVAVEVPTKALHDAVRELLRSRESFRRHAALRILASGRDGESEAVLLEHWKAHFVDRDVLAEAFAAHGKVRMTGLIVETLRSEQDSFFVDVYFVIEQRRTFAAALARLATPQYAPRFAALTMVLEREKDAHVVVQVVHAMAKARVGAAIPALATLLNDQRETSQPPEISSIRRFPWNARVRDVTAWAIATIRDGKEPFAVEDLSRLPVRGGEDEKVVALREDVEGWWAEQDAKGR